LGARLIKEHGIGVEEVHACLQDLDETIASQKQIEDSLGKFTAIAIYFVIKFATVIPCNLLVAQSWDHIA
jgi:hypothetical protein